MAMEITNRYSSYAAQSMVSSTKKKETENTSETAGGSKSKSTTDYVSELAKLVPSVELKVGNTFSTAQSGITLTINPQLLEKMQNDPEKEKEMKELIKGVESAVNMMENVNKATGWTVVYKHCYIDENGKFRSIAYLRNDFMLNMSDKLREERKKNSEELIEKTKEKAAEKKETLEEILEEKKAEKTGEGTANKAGKVSAFNKAEQLLNEKMAVSKDGRLYLNETDFEELMEAAKEDNAGKPYRKEKSALLSKEDHAVKVSISREGIKKLQESSMYGTIPTKFPVPKKAAWKRSYL